MQLWVSLTAAAAAVFLRSRAYPAVDEWTPAFDEGAVAVAGKHVRMHIMTRWMWHQAEPISECANVTYTADQVLQSPLYWPYSGLWHLQRQVKEQYDSLGARDRGYRSRTANYVGTAADSLEANYTGLMQCTADSMDDFAGSPYTALCTCLQRVETTAMCAWTSTLAAHTLCYDQMKQAASFRSDAEKQASCAELTSSNYGVTLSDRCAGWVAGAVSALELELYPANYPSGTPQAITAGVAEKETRTYYLLHKALQRLIRFTEGYELCLNEDDSADLESLDLKFTPLPTWTAQKTWWMFNGKNSTTGTLKAKLPFAVVAERTDCDEDDASCSESNSLLVLVRDARNSFEAALGATYEAGRQLDPRAEGVIVHAGYDMAARQIVPGLSVFIAEWLAAKQRQNAKVTYAGYGLLGSGVAAVVAHDVAAQFPLNPEGMVVQHDLVTFESGRVGNNVFNLRLAQNANVRNVASTLSPMSEFPCEAPRSCNREWIAQTGDADGAFIGQFLQLPGHVEPGRLPAAVEAANLVAQATCAIPCWAATTSCADDLATSMCEASQGCSPLS